MNESFFWVRSFQWTWWSSSPNLSEWFVHKSDGSSSWVQLTDRSQWLTHHWKGRLLAKTELNSAQVVLWLFYFWRDTVLTQFLFTVIIRVDRILFKDSPFMFHGKRESQIWYGRRVSKWFWPYPSQGSNMSENILTKMHGRRFLGALGRDLKRYNPEM